MVSEPVKQILDTWMAFLEHEDHPEREEIIANARKVLGAAPEDLVRAFVTYTERWGRDDMVLMDSVIDYIEVLANQMQKTHAYDINSGDWQDKIDIPGPFICWRDIDGNDYLFEVVEDVSKQLVELDRIVKRKKSATFEDHLEELWQVENTWYRYAGGGRGFYWLQRLEVVWSGK